MHRDVEYTFGILKQLWRIIKSSICAHSLDLTDKIFKTCGASHNFLLQANDIEVPWEGSANCDFDDNIFENCNENDTQSYMHELHHQYGTLNSIDFLSIGSKIILNHEIFSTEERGDDDNSEVVAE